jgi:hypothetical protein
MVTLMVLAAGLALFVLLAVRKGQKLSAGEVVANYVNATLAGRTAEAYRLLSSRDQSRESLSAYQARRSLGHGLIAQMIAGKMNHTVENESVNDDRATVTVVTSGPDFKRIMNEILPEWTGPAFPENNLEAFIFVCRNITRLLEKYRGSGMPLKNDTEVYQLIREKEGWKIRLEP